MKSFIPHFVQNTQEFWWFIWGEWHSDTTATLSFLTVLKWQSQMLLKNVLYCVDWYSFTFCFSAPCYLCLCPCPFSFTQSPSFYSVSCQNRAELLECLYGMSGEKWRREVGFVRPRALYLSIAMRREKCIALSFTSCCSFHFWLCHGPVDFPCEGNQINRQMGNFWQEGETLPASQFSTWHWPPFLKGLEQCNTWTHSFGVSSIRVCIGNIRRYKYIP